MPMRQLRSCDFCDEEAAGVYEVLPPELSPTETEQRRIVLCADCVETLETVLDPLLSRLGVDRGADSEPTEGATSSEGATPASEESTVPENAPTSDEPSRSEPSPADAGALDSESDAGSDGTGSDAADVAASSNRSDGSDTADSPDDPDEPSPSDSSGESGAPGRFGPPEGYTDVADSDEIEVRGLFTDPESDAETNGVDDVPRESDAEDPGRALDAAAPADRSADHPDRDHTAPTDGSDGGTASSAGRGEAGDEPEDFRTVMRLLGNREFPVRRSDVVELAGSAYQLDDGHVERILDHAIDRGVLAEDDGTLRKA